MRDTCAQLFVGKYKQLRKRFIHFCLNSPDIYYFNILRIITLVYHMYIDYEIYNLAYNTRKIIIYDILFIEYTMVEWDNDDTLLIIIRRQGY